MFRLLNAILMHFDRKYFCKTELKNRKCDELRKSCCMYRDVCKL